MENRNSKHGRLFVVMTLLIAIVAVILAWLNPFGDDAKHLENNQIETTSRITCPSVTITYTITTTTTTCSTSSSTFTTTETTSTATTTSEIAVETTTVIPYQEEVYEEAIEQNSPVCFDESYHSWQNELTYYSGPWGCYGASGRTLVNDYSCACNSLPLGTIVHIESDDGSICGDYRVDDTGGMADNVIDIFYADYQYVPSYFANAGRISCQVWIVE